MNRLMHAEQNSSSIDEIMPYLAELAEATHEQIQTLAYPQVALSGLTSWIPFGNEVALHTYVH